MSIENGNHGQLRNVGITSKIRFWVEARVYIKCTLWGETNSLSRVQVNPFQKDKYDVVPFVDFPAAKILLEFPALTSTAVIGPGRSLSLPNRVQVLFPNENRATFAGELSESEKAPEATSESCLLWKKFRSVTDRGFVKVCTNSS